MNTTQPRQGDCRSYSAEAHDCMKAPISNPGVALIALLNGVAGYALYSLVTDLGRLQRDSFVLSIATIMLVPTFLFAYAMPRLKVGPMWNVWRVPKRTYILSRPLLCVISTVLFGCALGMITCGLLVDWRVVAQGGQTLLAATCFLHSSNVRCQRPASTEFAMSFWGPLFRHIA